MIRETTLLPIGPRTSSESVAVTLPIDQAINVDANVIVSEGAKVTVDPIGNNSFDTSQGSTIPTSASPWVGVLTDYSNYVQQTIVFRGNGAGGARVKGKIIFTYASSATATPIVENLEIVADDSNVFIPVALQNVGPYMKIGYQPNAGEPALTFAELTLINYTTAAPDLTRFQTQNLGPGEPLKNVRALIEPSLQGQSTILGADRETFGAAITHSRISQISLDFSKALASNRITSTTSGGASTAQSAGQATLTSSSATTASAKLESISKIRYQPAREAYTIFTARFTTGVANSHQRIGLYDDNNGFFLGYDQATFGFTVRSGGTDSFTPLTDVNGDPLNASFLSRFTRGGILESLDPTKLNVYRIRFGWLGSSLQKFEIQSPDGAWLTIHSNLFPNLQTPPSIQNPSLPVRIEVIKSSAGATNLVVGTGSVDAGIVANPYGLQPSAVRGREHVDANAQVAGAATPVTQSIYIVNTGRILQVTSLSISIVNILTTGGEVQLLDGSGGPIKFRGQIAPATATTKQETQIDITFPEPLPFSTSVFMSVAAIGTGASLSAVIVGYEE